MHTNHQKLVSYLKLNGLTTSKELAVKLQVTNRTIKNYVSSINYENEVILCTRKGYLLNPQLKQIQEPTLQLPQTYEERSTYILKQSLLFHKKHLNIYDLCEYFCIGYSTLKTEIQRMNKEYEITGIQLVCMHDEIQIIGSEKHKRKMVSSLLYKETNQKFMDFTYLNTMFPEFDVRLLLSIIQKFCKKENYLLHDFSTVNLILHLSIIMNRIKDGNHIDTATYQSDINYDLQHTSQLFDDMQDAFHVQINDAERNEILLLLHTNINMNKANHMDELREIIKQDLLEFMYHLIEDVKEHFYLDLSSETFLVTFSLHMKNLLLRLRQQTYIRNPMTSTIRSSCPSVFDIAIYIAFQIETYIGTPIQEDEITFLALHIGAEIERQKKQQEKIQCVVLCPTYMHVATDLQNHLLKTFGSRIAIPYLITGIHELDTIECELLLSTIPLETYPALEVLIIPPLPYAIDPQRIHEAIGNVEEHRKKYFLKENFHRYFHDELYFGNLALHTKDDILHYLSTVMMSKGYVHDDFEDKVRQREFAASTAFGMIAIPHSMDMDATRTCICMAISKEGVVWGNTKVHIILLTAIQKEDSKTFHQLYEALVLLFSDTNILQLVKDCQHFEAFNTLINHYIS